MTKNTSFLIKATLLFAIFFFSSTGFAQTQDEIEQMLKGGTKETTEKVDKKTKKSKETINETSETAIENVEKADETTDKVVEEIIQESVDAEKKAKATKEKAVKEPKEKAEKTKTKAESTKDEIIQAAEETTETPEVTPEVVEENESVAKKSVVAQEDSEVAQKPSSSRSESFKKPLKSWSIGFGGNLTNPITDIRYKDFLGVIDPINEFQWGGQLRVTKMFDGAFGLMFNAQYNRIQGVFDTLVENKSQRDYLVNAGITDGVYFRNNVIQGSVNLYWNISNTLFNINKKYKSDMSGKPIRQRKFSLYTMAGLGFNVFDPHLMFTSDKAPASFAGIEFEQDQTAGLFIPFALGTKLKLSKTVDVGLEYGVNFLFNDRLDGFEFNNPSRRKNDAFSSISLNFDFKIGTKKKDKEHVEWTSPVEPIYDEIAKINKTMRLLTVDSDGDGVSNFFDKDNETPEDVAVDGSGRALDSDGDGVPDYMDLERFTDAGAEVDEFGIAIDSDGDGVPNHRDLEPDTKTGDLVNFQGISIQDKIKGGDTRGLFFPPVYFDTDKADVKRQYEEDLFLIARNMLRMEDVNFLLEGHCDERGSEEYNLALGKRRAEAVKKYLVDNYKIDPSRIEVVSKGKSELNSPRFHINRRVDVFIIEK